MLKVCNRCVMDTTDPNIVFDEKGYCNHCTRALKSIKSDYPVSLPSSEKKKALNALVDKIKKDGKNKEYDCVIGISGGVDSTYVAYLVKELGLRPIAIHLDNGWNSELSVINIQNICNFLGVDLYTHVIDWEEFRKLQLAFLYSSTPDSEIPTDHAIVSILFDVARKYNIKTILIGTNASTESIMPKAWSQGYFDWKYIKSVNKMFGGQKLKTLPHRSLFKMFWDVRVLKVNYCSILNYIEYNKAEAKKLISEKLGWRDYGYKHYESNYTKIYQSYILFKKFGFDKRKAHFSSLIITGQMKRDEAIKELKKLPYDADKIQEDIKYLTNKFNITVDEFERIMSLPPKTINDYPNNQSSFLYKGYNNIKKIVKKLLFR